MGKEFEEVKDSGMRHEWSTGARRDYQTGKGMPHLLPTLFLRRLAKHFENGAKKYGKDNWRKGIPLSSYIDSAFRHWLDLRDGKKDEDHPSSVIWNIACFIETVDLIEKGLLPKELDDVNWLQETNSGSTEEQS